MLYVQLLKTTYDLHIEEWVFSDFFFFLSWLTDGFCNAEVMRNTETPTSRLTTLHCAPSRGWSTRNVKNRHVYHLLSTKLHCVPPKWSSVQNCIVNLDLHVSASYRVCFLWAHLGKCTFSVLVTHQLYVLWAPPKKNKKNFGMTPTLKKHSSVLLRWCTT